MEETAHQNLINMNVYILTIHCIHNFGSVFQSYGLARYLCNQGYNTQIIDYRPSYYFKGRSIVKRYVSILLNPLSYIKQHRKYEEFIKNNLPVTNVMYKSLSELEDFDDKEAVYIAGGDQIWNSFHPCGRDDAYKLIFSKKGKKLAFGTSMGRTSFSEAELKQLGHKIEDYLFVGLREQSTVNMLKQYVNLPVKHVADPVLLLGKNEYMRFVGDKALIKGPYLVMYLAAKSELLEKAVEHVAKARNLKVVHVCGFKKKCKCDYFLKSTGPEELLNLIYYSNFVISASFHATLFSILFEKQFCTLLPEAGTNTRIEDLLSFYNLESRILHTISEIGNLDTDIDFTHVSEKRDAFSEQTRNDINDLIRERVL